MARPRDIPEGAEIIRTYAEFQWFLKAFANGHFTLLIVVGRPGLSKSASIKNALSDSRVCLIEGHVRPIQAYIELHEHRNQPVVLDDAQGLEDPAGRNLLTSLAQTDKVKNLEWLTSSRILSDAKVPTKFSTASRVCIITNRWSGSYKEIQALEDRGHLVYFDPTPDEVHKYVGTWLQFNAQDVYDFIGENLHLIDRPSCRLYVKALERKKAGGDWREFVLHHCHRTAKLVVQQISNDPSCLTEEERVQKAAEQARISRATYFRYKKELEENGQLQPVRPFQLEKIILTSKPPRASYLSVPQAEGNERRRAVGEGLALRIFRET
jgi:hypothetical protein